MYAMGEYQELEMLSRDLPVKYIIPDEGAIGWLDTWVISSGVEDVNLAHKWVDFFVQERVLGELQHAHVGSLTLETLSLDSTIIKLHADGSGARRKGGARRSGARAAAGRPSSTPWSPTNARP